MATLFEVLLLGEDEEHLRAVGEAALDEVERVERLLSRFDPAAELARVNREAATRPVLVSHELFAVLRDCRERCRLTEGYFDICVPLQGSGPGFLEGVRLDEARRTVSFASPAVALDPGGYGKGYALDAAAVVLDEFGVSSALLHGGTSSVLARGSRDGAPWVVGLADPFAGGNGEIARVRLADAALSCSAVHDRGRTPDSHEESDIIDPIAGRPLREQAGCCVLAPTATLAEVLSTALLVMGRERALGYLERQGNALADCSVCLIEQRAEHTTVEWLLKGRGMSDD
jgi:thiamine biosynthesis lipoprotein